MKKRENTLLFLYRESKNEKNRNTHCYFCTCNQKMKKWENTLLFLNMESKNEKTGKYIATVFL